MIKIAGDNKKENVFFLGTFTLEKVLFSNVYFHTRSKNLGLLTSAGFGGCAEVESLEGQKISRVIMGSLGFCLNTY